MTLYGVGLGPGEADLVTVRGKRVLESVDTVYSPGRLSRSVALEHVPESKIGDLDFPMMTDEETLRAAFTRPQGKTLSAEEDHVSEFVGMGDVTTCIYLGTHAVGETMDRLLEDGHDPEMPVAVVYHASWPDEDVILGTLETIGDRVEEAGYRASALVIIGEVVTGAGYERSYQNGDWANRGVERTGGPTSE